MKEGFPKNPSQMKGGRRMFQVRKQFVPKHCGTAELGVWGNATRAQSLAEEAEEQAGTRTFDPEGQ